jgi:hypothetical protein
MEMRTVYQCSIIIRIFSNVITPKVQSQVETKMPNNHTIFSCRIYAIFLAEGYAGYENDLSSLLNLMSNLRIYWDKMYPTLPLQIHGCLECCLQILWKSS